MNESFPHCLANATLLEHLHDRPPVSILTSITIAYQTIFSIVGIPINISSLLRNWKLSGQYKRRSNSGGYCGNKTYKYSANLNISNLLVLLLYYPIESVWQIFFYWYLGDAPCKIFMFFGVFSFHLWSNTIAIIAFDMFITIKDPLGARRNSSRRIKGFIIGSWVLAACLAFPQFFTQGIVTVPQSSCRYQCYFVHYENQLFRFGYQLYHVITLFYIPLFGIIFSNVAIGVILAKAMRKRSTMRIKESTAALNNDTQLGSSVNNRGGQQKFKRNLSGHIEDGTKKMETRKRGSTWRQEGRTKNKKFKLKKETKLLRTTVPIIALYVLSWLPYQVVALWQILCNSPHCHSMAKYLDWLEGILIAGACLNPFLYNFRPKDDNKLSCRSNAVIKRNEPPQSKFSDHQNMSGSNYGNRRNATALTKQHVTLSFNSTSPTTINRETQVVLGEPITTINHNNILNEDDMNCDEDSIHL